MSASVAVSRPAEATPASLAAEDPAWVRHTLIGAAVGFLTLLLIAPLVLVFASAFSEGIQGYVDTVTHPDTLAAIQLTVLTAGISVPLNFVFGIASAWVISKYDFPGKSALVTLIDLPFSVSPVIAGLVFVLLFGSRSWLGGILSEANIKLLFAPPAIVIATTFVTFPLVAREVLAVMESQGTDDEEAALTLGATGWQVLFRVTLPKVRWGALYGVILCNARAMGEFGAVSVVSGHIRGETNTMPLHVEILYNEYAFHGAFTVASLLALLALVTLGVKRAAEWKEGRRATAAAVAEGAAP